MKDGQPKNVSDDASAKESKKKTTDGFSDPIVLSTPKIAIGIIAVVILFVSLAIYVAGATYTMKVNATGIVFPESGATSLYANGVVSRIDGYCGKSMSSGSTIATLMTGENVVLPEDATIVGIQGKGTTVNQSTPIATYVSTDEANQTKNVICFMPASQVKGITEGMDADLALSGELSSTSKYIAGKVNRVQTGLDQSVVADIVGNDDLAKKLVDDSAKAQGMEASDSTEIAMVVIDVVEDDGFPVLTTGEKSSQDVSLLQQYSVSIQIKDIKIWTLFLGNS